eukprot:scaffold14212_cov31-Tisochrysis_lutea.AAC.1
MQVARRLAFRRARATLSSRGSTPRRRGHQQSLSVRTRRRGCRHAREPSSLHQSSRASCTGRSVRAIEPASGRTAVEIHGRLRASPTSTAAEERPSAARATSLMSPKCTR